MSTLQTLKKHKGAFFVSAAVNIGSILFGFDTGIAGAVTALQSFKNEFDLASDPSKLAYSSGNIVALLNAGAFFGALAPPVLSTYVGRKSLLAIAGVFFLIGGILQTAAMGPGLSMIYAGRSIAGFGVGMISNTAPVFVAESAPKELRGVMMSAFEMFLVSGGMLSYWTVYGCSLHLPATSVQWRTPLSLQIILAAIVIISSFLIPESPRWLAQKGKWQEASNSLCYLRGATSSDVEISEELAEMKAQLDEEVALTSGRTIKELFLKKNISRLLWTLGMGLFAMWCGHNAILYYGPAVFKQIGFTSQNSALLASGVFTCLKFVSTIVFIVGGVHYFRRKTLMIGGAFFMGGFLFALGAVLKTHPPLANAPVGDVAASGKAMMALIYLFVIAYSVSLGPLMWIFIGYVLHRFLMFPYEQHAYHHDREIFPTRIRDYGMAVGAAWIWALNYIVSKIAPIAILNIGWQTWMIFGTMNIVGVIFFWFLPETKDLSLEEMDVLFGVVDQGVRRKDVEANLGGDRVSVVVGEKGTSI